MNCTVCSETFAGRYNQKTCSPKCGIIHDRNRSRQYQRSTRAEIPPISHTDKSCMECGSVFKPKMKTSNFCSHPCQRKASVRRFKRKVAAANKAERQAAPRQCQNCSCGFLAETYQQAYCSMECRRVVEREKIKALYTPKRKASNERGCPQCGSRFVYRDSRQVGCSLECGRVISARVNGGVRRVRLRGATVERVDPFKVFERDRWTCQECGVRTPKALRGKHKPTSPELDHIVPVARGGEHSYRNTQCLCRRCNTIKGAKPRGQMRLFG